MEEVILKMQGKKIDVNCAANSMFRGEVITVSNGVLTLRDEDEKTVYIAIERIAAVYECGETHSRPGFVV